MTASKKDSKCSTRLVFGCFFLLLVSCVFFTLFAPLKALAEPSAASPERPKIALVLGGGGARGAAHVGVLKVLEEQHIPIDYIAGTSMGAIVGGAYASGLSPQEIEDTLNSVNWGSLFDDKAPREELSFRRKRDERRFTGLELGVQNGKIVLPPGAMAGRKLEFLLQSVFLDVSGINNFDNLPIPFRAVATDIETGDPIVLGSGSLPKAIRASMSIPGAFAPVRIRGHLVDGFVSNNVPVDVAKQLGGKIIIAVDVGTPLAKSDQLTTLIDIVNQVSGIATMKNVYEQLQKLTAGDLLIRPELGDLAVTDFQKIAQIIPLGKEAAEKQVAELKRYSVSEKEYQVFLQKQRRKPQAPIMVDFVRIAPTSRVAPQRIESRLSVETGQALDLPQLSNELDRIQAIGEFESVGFEIVSEGDKKGVLIDPREKPWGPDYLRFGFNLYNDFKGDAYYNFLLDYTRTCLNELGGEWRNELQIGKNSQVHSEFYQPLDYSNTFFLSPLVEARQAITDIYNKGDRLAEYRSKTYGGGSDLGFNMGTAAESRAGLWWGHTNANPSTGSADLPDLDVARAAARLSFTYDQLDDDNFPRHGLYAQTSGWFEEQALGASSSYKKFAFDGLRPFSYGQHTLTPRVKVGYNPSDDLPYYDQFTLGGFGSLDGFRMEELRGRDMMLGRLSYYYQLSRAVFSFTTSSYLGFALDWGNAWQTESEMSFSDLVFGESVFFGADTILGPVYLALGSNNELKRGEVTLALGQKF